ncbi:MAG: UbiA family prenyltransferase [Patescibacteria group bacterium]
MVSLKFLYKVTRIEQCLIVSLSTWLIALLSDGPLWFNQPKIAAGVSMFFSCLGASLYHYGRRHDVYAKKWYDLVLVNRPMLLILSGTISFCCSIVTAAAFLPPFCTWIAIANFMIIMLYANFLDQYWPFKNIAIALVCVTPIIMGWYSGHRLHPIVPFLIAAIFCAYLAREILKDIQDRSANHGKRFTMVMSIGITASQRIAAALLSLAALFLIGGLVPLVDSSSIVLTIIAIPYLWGIFLLFRYARYLLAPAPIAHQYRTIDFGMLALMISTLGLRVLLH